MIFKTTKKPSGLDRNLWVLFPYLKLPKCLMRPNSSQMRPERKKRELKRALAVVLPHERQLTQAVWIKKYTGGHTRRKVKCHPTVGPRAKRCPTTTHTLFWWLFCFVFSIVKWHTKSNSDSFYVMTVATVSSWTPHRRY